MHISPILLSSVSNSVKNKVLITSSNVQIWISCIEFTWEVVLIQEGNAAEIGMRPSASRRPVALSISARGISTDCGSITSTAVLGLA